MQNINAKNIVSIAGIATTTERKGVFGGATSAELLEEN